MSQISIQEFLADTKTLRECSIEAFNNAPD